jgi:hypothetical protein
MQGSPTTFDAKPASKAATSDEGRYCQLMKVK